MKGQNYKKYYEVENYMSVVAPSIDKENKAVKIFSGVKTYDELVSKFYERFYEYAGFHSGNAHCTALVPHLCQKPAFG